MEHLTQLQKKGPHAPELVVFQAGRKPLSVAQIKNMAQNNDVSIIGIRQENPTPQEIASALYEAVTATDENGRYVHHNIYLSGGYGAEDTIFELEKIIKEKGPLPNRAADLNLFGFSDVSQLHHYMGQRGIATPIYYSNINPDEMIAGIQNFLETQERKQSVVLDLKWENNPKKLATTAGYTQPGSITSVEGRRTHQLQLFADKSNMVFVEIKTPSELTLLKNTFQSIPDSENITLILSKDMSAKMVAEVKNSFPQLTILSGAPVGHGSCLQTGQPIPLFSACSVTTTKEGTAQIKIATTATAEAQKLQTLPKREKRFIQSADAVPTVIIHGDDQAGRAITSDLTKITQRADSYTIVLEHTGPDDRGNDFTWQRIDLGVKELLANNIIDTSVKELHLLPLKERLENYISDSSHLTNPDELKKLESTGIFHIAQTPKSAQEAEEAIRNLKRYFPQLKRVTFNGKEMNLTLNNKYENKNTSEQESNKGKGTIMATRILSYSNLAKMSVNAQRGIDSALTSLQGAGISETAVLAKIKDAISKNDMKELQSLIQSNLSSAQLSPEVYNKIEQAKIPERLMRAAEAKVVAAHAKRLNKVVDKFLSNDSKLEALDPKLEQPYMKDGARKQIIDLLGKVFEGQPDVCNIDAVTESNLTPKEKAVLAQANEEDAQAPEAGKPDESIFPATVEKSQEEAKEIVQDAEALWGKEGMPSEDRFKEHSDIDWKKIRHEILWPGFKKVGEQKTPADMAEALVMFLILEMPIKMINAGFEQRKALDKEDEKKFKANRLNAITENLKAHNLSQTDLYYKLAEDVHSWMLEDHSGILERIKKAGKRLTSRDNILIKKHNFAKTLPRKKDGSLHFDLFSNAQKKTYAKFMSMYALGPDFCRFLEAKAGVSYMKSELENIAKYATSIKPVANKTQAPAQQETPAPHVKPAPHRTANMTGLPPLQEGTPQLPTRKELDTSMQELDASIKEFAKANNADLPKDFVSNIDKYNITGTAKDFKVIDCETGKVYPLQSTTAQKDMIQEIKRKKEALAKMMQALNEAQRQANRMRDKQPNAKTPNINVNFNAHTNE